MKRVKKSKYPNSVNLFLFCQSILQKRMGKRVQDQDIGALLEFNPSDCSHWKRGEKNIRSIHAFSAISSRLDISMNTIQDIARGKIDHEEGLFESQELKSMFHTLTKVHHTKPKQYSEVQRYITHFVQNIHTSCDWTTPPLYLPELMHFFPQIHLQKAEIFDRLTRILKKTPHEYVIQHRKKDLTAHTRIAIAYDIARIITTTLRHDYPDLGDGQEQMHDIEAILFSFNAFSPYHLIQKELQKIDIRKNIVQELAETLWVPRSVISFQLNAMAILQMHDMENIRLTNEDKSSHLSLQV